MSSLRFQLSKSPNIEILVLAFGADSQTPMFRPWEGRTGPYLLSLRVLQLGIDLAPSLDEDDSGFEDACCVLQRFFNSHLPAITSSISTRPSLQITEALLEQNCEWYEKRFQCITLLDE